MNGWVVLGEFYVRPIDREELYVIEPDGVQYKATRIHIMADMRVLIGTAPTPSACARLVDESRGQATGGPHDPLEHRRQAMRESERRVAAVRG